MKLHDYSLKPTSGLKLHYRYFSRSAQKGKDVLKKDFLGIFGKTPVLKISEDSQKNVFGKVLFKQFDLSILSPITLLKTDSIKNVSHE